MNHLINVKIKYVEGHPKKKTSLMNMKTSKTSIQNQKEKSEGLQSQKMIMEIHAMIQK